MPTTGKLAPTILAAAAVTKGGPVVVGVGVGVLVVPFVLLVGLGVSVRLHPEMPSDELRVTWKTPSSAMVDLTSNVRSPGLLAV